VGEQPTQIGPYAIERELGRGGMGVVYLARDGRLDRQVAIKALMDEGGGSGERIARFEREARTLAGLNHPNIAAIYGVERDAQGIAYLVLEYVDGETLVERLRRGAMEVEEAIEVCAQIAAGVEAAHDAGVVHRDLKPGNVKISAAGKVKVLDFGLAKSEPVKGRDASKPDLSASPTVTSPAQASGPVTQPGMVMGTAPYMSPEQARGKHVDRRTDIWAFGCVLHECLTARSLFAGETVTDTLAAILEREIDLSGLPARTPVRVRELLRHCLERDSRRRLKDMGDARLTLESALAGREWSTTGAMKAVGERDSRRVRRRVMAVVPWVVAIAAVVGAGWVWSNSKNAGEGLKPRDTAAVRFDVPIPPVTSSYSTDSVLMQRLAVSPDGHRIVVAGCEGGVERLYVRGIGSGEVMPLEGSEGAVSPCFSPDGGRIAFVTVNGGLCVMPSSGGSATKLCEIGTSRGIAWSEDGRVYFCDSYGEKVVMAIMPEAGAKAEAVTALDGTQVDFVHRYPCPLPGGGGVLYVRPTGGAYPESSIVGVRFDDSVARVVLPRAYFPQLTADGSLVFARDESLYIVEFDSSTLTVRGEPRPVMSEAAIDIGPLGVAHAAVGRDGTIAFIPGPFRLGDNQIVWVDQFGKTEKVLDTIYAANPTISGDGRYLGFDQTKPIKSVWLYEPERDLLRTIPTPFARSWIGKFSRGSDRVYYYETGLRGARILETWIDQRSEPRQVATLQGLGAMCDLSPDGKSILAEGSTLSQSGTMLAIDTTTGAVRPLIASAGTVASAVYSPDGRWVAYAGDETGRLEISVRSADGSGGRERVSVDGGWYPRWSADGKKLYFWTMRRGVDDGTLACCEVTGDADRIRIGRPREVFKSTPENNLSISNFDVSSDGEKFLMCTRMQRPDSPKLMTVITNWVASVKDREKATPTQ